MTTDKELMQRANAQNVRLLNVMVIEGSRVGAVVRALAFHQCVPGSIPALGVICGVEFVGSLLCSERFFSGYSGFPLSS